MPTSRLPTSAKGLLALLEAGPAEEARFLAAVEALTPDQALRCRQVPHRLLALRAKARKNAPQSGDAARLLVLLERALDARPAWVHVDVLEDEGTSRKTLPLPMLAKAAHLGDADSVTLLLARGADPRAGEDPFGLALKAAIQSKLPDDVDQAATLRALLASGAFRGRALGWALGWAAEAAALGAIDALLAHGAPFSPLPTNLDNLELARRRVPLRWDEVDHSPSNALALACFFQDDDALAGRSHRGLATLLANDGSRAVLDQGWGLEFGAAVHAAAFMGNRNGLRQLLDAGAAVNPPATCPTPCPKTPLMAAVGEAGGACVAMLLAAGADVHAVDTSGWTALHYLARADFRFSEPSASGGTMEGVMMNALSALIEAGASWTVADHDGQTPLDVARLRRNHALIRAVAARERRLELEATLSDLEATLPEVPRGRRGPRL